MGRRICLFIVIVVAVTAVSCAPPIGNNGGSGSGPNDSLWAIPNRVAYDFNELFYRNSDLQVFTTSRGAVQHIPTTEVEIGIAENPEYPDDVEFIALDENYSLTTKGRKLVVIRYGGAEAHYSIEVRDPFGLGGGGGGGGGGSGIEIRWWDDPDEPWDVPVVNP